MGVTGSGKTFTMANVIAADAAADAGPVAQQDAGGPALRRIPRVLSPQRRRLFRQLLRLLSARSLHSAARHLHRERRVDQRRDRPPAADGDKRPGQPPRRDRRRQRVLHLRLGLAEGLSGDDGAAAYRRHRRPRRAAGEAGRHPVRAERSRFSRGKFRVRGDVHRMLARLRRVRLSHRTLGRRDREPVDHQSAHAAKSSASSTSCSSIRPSTSSCREERIERRVVEIQAENWTQRLEEFRAPGQAARSPAARTPARASTWK